MMRNLRSGACSSFVIKHSFHDLNEKTGINHRKQACRQQPAEQSALSLYFTPPLGLRGGRKEDNMKDCYRLIAALAAAWLMFATAWAQDYPTVWDISAYNGSEAFVYETKSCSWYAMNNKNVYERWGVVEQVADVNDATFYPGKYVRVKQVIYKYADGWTPTPLLVTPFNRPANGVYVIDKGGHAVAVGNWQDQSNSSRSPMAIAIISNNTAAVVSLNDVKGNRELEIWSKQIAIRLNGAKMAL